MAGRRLLDAAKLFNAARTVAKQHVALRSQQFDVYSKTSTVAKAVKDQTDRVTLTAQAAIKLAQRLSESESPQYNYARSPADESTAPQDAYPRNGDGLHNGTNRASHQGNRYERSEDGSPVQPPASEEVEVKQEKAERYPLPDGTIPPAGAGISNSSIDKETYSERPEPEPAKEPLAEEQDHEEDSLQPVESGASTIPDPTSNTSDESLKTRKLQRQAESQIPSVSADPPHAGHEESITIPPDGVQGDVYYSRQSETCPTLSSLPRTKIPKKSENAQGSTEEIQDGKINSDVFYSSEGQQNAQKIPSQDAVSEQEAIPEDVNTDVFHSPRISKIMGGPEKASGQSQLNLKAASRTPVDRTGLAAGRDQDTFTVRESDGTSPAKPGAPSINAGQQPESPSKGEMEKLAQDVAKDAENASKIPPDAQDVISASEKLPFQMRESRVPSSRFGRLWQYGGLATSMALGAVSESFRRATGGGAGESLILSPGNMERLVTKLSRMRGAALKLGQMISFQDLKMLPAPIHEVLQRVQDSADYMPAWQRDRVLASNLGSDWRDLFSSFDEIPIAAASIGQVHKAVLKSNSQDVAVKVQYPGVANSIDSDLDNLSILLTASRLLPKGLYLEKTIANARTELAWECDYIREAECGIRYKAMISDETSTFTVPTVFREASGREVLTAELMHGIAVTKLPHLSQDQRDWIGTQILRLCLREITEFNFMQTDPNWTNFLYNTSDQKLELLDFGASREFPKSFIDPYVKTLLAASRNDRASIRDYSVQLGYLTGNESKAMLDAHVQSVLTLGEPFGEGAPEVYDFRDQTITDRVRGLIPVMVRERLAPPPEETYSLHRKLSGAFLLCARLGSRVRCRELFERTVIKYQERNH